MINLSIITVSFNSSNTVDIRKSYIPCFEEKNIKYRIISELDSGIYDAINKGIYYSTGNWIGIINSDDYYSDNIFNQVFVQTVDADLIYGNICLLSAQDKLSREIKPKSLVNIKNEMILFHPAVFVKRNTYAEVGVYDTSYKLSSDYKFLLKAWLENKEFLYIDKCFAYYDVGGSTGNNLLKSWREVKSIKVELGLGKLNGYFYFYLQVVKRAILKLTGKIK